MGKDIIEIMGKIPEPRRGNGIRHKLTGAIIAFFIIWSEISIPKPLICFSLLMAAKSEPLPQATSSTWSPFRTSITDNLTPLHYWRSKGLNHGGKQAAKTSPTGWVHATIYKILTLQEYCGDVINFKTFSKSYRNKKRIETDEKDRAIFWGVHEAIIDRAVWKKVQDMRGSRKKPTKKSPERSIFSGLLKCADCGGNLNFHFNQGNHDIKYFNCATYNRGRGECNATHYIRLDFLEQVVLQEIQRLTPICR